MEEDVKVKDWERADLNSLTPVIDEVWDVYLSATLRF